MAVDSTLELYTTLFGWLFYNSIWEVLAATGIVFLPFVGILIDAAVDSYMKEESESAGATSLRLMEVQVFVAFFVVLLTGVPAMPLTASELSFSPKAVIGTLAQPTETPADNQTTYGGTVSFVDYPNQVDLPVFWYLVLSFSAGFNRAVMEDVPAAVDLRDYIYRLGDVKIDNPAIQNEVNDFFRDCFVEARSKYLRERPDTAQTAALLNQYGRTDPDWIGSRLYLNVDGYYNALRSDSIREGFPYSQLRDVEWDVTNSPTFGKPYCSEWWTDSSHGLAQKILDQTGGMDLTAAAAEPAWDAGQRRDAVIRAALLNSSPRWTTRGYDFAYGNLVHFGSQGQEGIVASVQNAAEQGLAAYGLARESLTFAAFLRIFLESAPMIQALILMGLYSLMPFFVLMSRYKLSIFIIGALILFIVKFWTTLWFFAWWVDQNLIRALYPDPGSITTLFNIDMTVKRIVLNFLTGMMYIGFPMLLSIYLSFAGIHTARNLDGATEILGRGMGGASRMNPRIPRMMAKLKKFR